MSYDNEDITYALKREALSRMSDEDFAYLLASAAREIENLRAEVSEWRGKMQCVVIIDDSKRKRVTKEKKK